MARPSLFSAELADAIVERLTRETLTKICADKRMPDRSTVNRWMLTNEDFATRCARAREIHADALVEETIEIADEAPERAPMGGVDVGSVSDKKVRIAARQWYAEKVASKKYGSKVQVTGKDEGPLQHQRAPADLSNLSDEDLDDLERLAAKLGGDQGGEGKAG